MGPPAPSVSNSDNSDRRFQATMDPSPVDALLSLGYNDHKINISCCSDHALKQRIEIQIMAESAGLNSFTLQLKKIICLKVTALRIAPPVPRNPCRPPFLKSNE